MSLIYSPCRKAGNMLSVSGRFRNLRKKTNGSFTQMPPVKQNRRHLLLVLLLLCLCKSVQRTNATPYENRSFEAKADAKVQQIPEPTKLLDTFFRKNLKFSCFRTKYNSIFGLYLINIIKEKKKKSDLLMSTTNKKIVLK